MKFNEILEKLTVFNEKFSDFDITYLSIDLKKDKETIELSDDGFVDEDNNHSPITCIEVEHEISRDKTVNIETVGDLKKIINNLEEDVIIDDLTLFTKNKEENQDGVCIQKRCWCDKGEGSISYQKRWSL